MTPVRKIKTVTRNNEKYLRLKDIIDWLDASREINRGAIHGYICRILKELNKINDTE